MKAQLEEIAKLLPGSWHVPKNKHYDHGGFIEDDTGRSIFLRLKKYCNTTQGSARGDFPQDIDGSSMSASSWLGSDAVSSEIKFNVEKGAEKIAKDIERRLFPVYLPQIAQVQEKIQKQNEAVAIRDKALEEIRKITGGTVRGNSRGYEKLHLPWNDDVYGEIDRRYYDDIYDVKISKVPRAMMDELALIIKKYQAG